MTARRADEEPRTAAHRPARWARRPRPAGSPRPPGPAGTRRTAAAARAGLSLLGVAAALAALVLTAGPLSPSTVPVRGAQLPVALGVPDVVCPGPETLVVPDGGQQVAPGGPVRVLALAAAADRSSPVRAALTATGPASALATQDAGGARVGGRLRLSAPAGADAVAGDITLDRRGPVLLAAAAGTAAQLAAGQLTLSRDGDLRGLSSLSCAPAQTSSWLVGGSTLDGHRLRLVLSNPAPAPAVVDVQVWGPQGPVSTPSVDAVVVPAQEQVSVFVDALAPGLAAVAVQVQARVGQVQATLHHTVMRGLVPGGVDDVSPGAAPARRQVLPGVSLVDGYSKTAGDPQAAGSTVVRVLVPGAEEAVVRVRLLDATGEVPLPDGGVVAVAPGAVRDIPVRQVPSGTYTAVVESDVPVAAGALVGRGPQRAEGPAEFAWVAAAEPVRGSGLVALPHGPDTVFTAAALGGDGAVQVAAVFADGSLGAARQLQIPASAAATLSVDQAAAGLWIDAGAQVGSVFAAAVRTVPDQAGPLISVPAIQVVPAPPARSQAVLDQRLGARD